MTAGRDMLAVVPVRHGALPAGADEAAAEAGGRVLVVGRGAAEAAASLTAALADLQVAEAGEYAPASWAAAIAPLVAGTRMVVLPGSPDGRDLAPRLAHATGRTLLAGAVEVAPDRVVTTRHGGLVADEHRVDRPAVATLVPGVRGVEPRAAGYRPPPPRPVTLTPAGGADPEVLDVTPPDPSTMDLAEAGFILAGGAGLGSADAFELLARVAGALGASVGATRVVTDAGWVGAERQIGTTGVAVAPRLYLAFGISGAVQHTSGLGDPEHILSVNLDASCPMMTMAEVAVVADAPAVLQAMAGHLGLAGSAPTGSARAGGEGSAHGVGTREGGDGGGAGRPDREVATGG